MRATASAGVRSSPMQESPVKLVFLRHRDAGRRWRMKVGEGGLGALGEIRTPDPRIRSPMLYPAELRARAWGRLPDLAGQGQPPAAGSIGRPGGLWRRRLAKNLSPTISCPQVRQCRLPSSHEGISVPAGRWFFAA